MLVFDSKSIFCITSWHSSPLLRQSNCFYISITPLITLLDVFMMVAMVLVCSNPKLYPVVLCESFVFSLHQYRMLVPCSLLDPPVGLPSVCSVAVMQEISYMPLMPPACCRFVLSVLNIVYIHFMYSLQTAVRTKFK